MWRRCDYHARMTVVIQIRNVPRPLHRKLKSRAARAGVSLSQYLLNEISRSAEQPTLEELRKRLERRSAVKLPVSSADVIRAGRGPL
jgi:antitoxin FitA